MSLTRRRLRTFSSLFFCTNLQVHTFRTHRHVRHTLGIRPAGGWCRWMMRRAAWSRLQRHGCQSELKQKWGWANLLVLLCLGPHSLQTPIMKINILFQDSRDGDKIESTLKQYRLAVLIVYFPSHSGYTCQQYGTLPYVQYLTLNVHGCEILEEHTR